MVWETGQPSAGFTTAEKPWLPVPYAHAMLAADGQERKPDSVLNHYKAVLAFRKNYAALRDGDMVFLDTQQDLLAFTRAKGHERLLFVFNLTREPVEFLIPTDLKVDEVLTMPGFQPLFDETTVKLDGLDVFCAILA